MIGYHYFPKITAKMNSFLSLLCAFLLVGFAHVESQNAPQQQPGSDPGQLDPSQFGQQPNLNFPNGGGPTTTTSQPQNQPQSQPQQQQPSFGNPFQNPNSPPFTFQIPLPGSNPQQRPPQQNPGNVQIRFVPLGAFLLGAFGGNNNNNQNHG